MNKLVIIELSQMFQVVDFPFILGEFLYAIRCRGSDPSTKIIREGF